MTITGSLADTVSGRYKSVASRTPSRMGTHTLRSILTPYWGAGAGYGGPCCAGNAGTSCAHAHNVIPIRKALFATVRSFGRILPQSSGSLPGGTRCLGAVNPTFTSKCGIRIRVEADSGLDSQLALRNHSLQ